MNRGNVPTYVLSGTGIFLGVVGWIFISTTGDLKANITEIQNTNVDYESRISKVEQANIDIDQRLGRIESKLDNLISKK